MSHESIHNHDDLLTYLEDSLHVVFGCVLVDGGLCVPAHHLVDGVDDVQHLLLGDDAVAVDVVEREGPLQPLL